MHNYDIPLLENKGLNQQIVDDDIPSPPPLPTGSGRRRRRRQTARKSTNIQHDDANTNIARLPQMQPASAEKEETVSHMSGTTTV